jgi:hypothetical protein
MAESKEPKKEEVSFVMPRFNTVYNLAMEQVKFKDMRGARKSYSRLLQLYNDVSASDASYIDKQDAYQKLKIIHSEMFKPTGVITFGNVIIPITLVVIVLLIVFFVKPQLVGVTGFFTAEENSPPVWDSDVGEFRISGRAQIDLSEYFSDANGDRLAYVSTSAPNLQVYVAGSTVTLVPSEGISGTRFLTFSASDSMESARKRVMVVIE